MGDVAIANHVYFVAERIDDLGELVKRTPRPVELTPAMIGHHDNGGPVAPMSTARFASAMLMTPLRQNCLLHFLRTSTASCQFID